MSKVKNENELDDFRKNLIDRFGEIPDQGNELLNSVKLKWIALKIGIERYVIKQGKCIGYFIEDQGDSIFKSKIFGIFLSNIQKEKSKIILKEKQTNKGLNRIDQLYNYIKFLTKDSLSL